jgi:hypothetical protein
MKVTLEGQGEPKSIKGRQGPLLRIHVCLSCDLWLLASEPNNEVRSMTHLALRLTTRSEARNQRRYALRLTTRSEA